MSGVRWKCNLCGGELKTLKEKMLKTCNTCALEGAKGFDMMAKGQFKKGISQVLTTTGIKKEKQDVMQEHLEKALSKKKEKIIKKLKKKGLTDEEIQEGLAEFDNGLKK